MQVLHISSVNNRSSIKENGIIPTIIKNEGHLFSFRNRGIISNSDNKAIYTWEDCDKNEKFVRDLIYAKVFIHPRNEMEYETDFSKIKTLDILPYFEMLYDVYKIQVPDEDSSLYHSQEPSDNKYNSTYEMEDFYAHDDKHLFIYNKPLKEFSIVGQAYYEYDKKLDKIIIKNI
jgi:hypothetical protein